MPTVRTPGHPIEALFLNRWSPRAFDASSMPKADILTMLEAARWAPSAFNVQPWRFLYSERNDQNWATFVDLLDPFNRSWAHTASALVIMVSDTIMPGDGERPDKTSRYNSFDTGAAWAQFALQASALGYHAHAMAGVLFDEARTALQIPERFKIEIAVAVGKRAASDTLPLEMQEREHPSDRTPLEEIIFEGAFSS